MSAVSNQQIYDLLLEISDDLTHLEASTDELLLDMKMLNQELDADRRQLTEARAILVRSRALLQ